MRVSLLWATLGCLLLVTVPGVHAGFIGDIWGVVTDPLKLRQSSQNVSNSIERSLQELSRLQKTTDYDVQQRLEQIQQIAESTISGISGAIDKAERDIAQLEKQINRDAIDLIYRAQCLSANVNDQLQNAMSRAIQQIEKSNPNVSLIGIPIVRFNVESDGLPSPDKVYTETKRAMIAELDTLNDKSPADKIYWTYQNLENLARWTRCRYLDQDAAVAFTSEMDEMERLSIPWRQTVNVKLFLNGDRK